jgi:hypothetical protein
MDYYIVGIRTLMFIERLESILPTLFLFSANKHKDENSA